MKKTGRPQFKIEPSRLLELRKEAALTQEALGELVFTKSKDSLNAKVSYQRVERNGKTSKSTANRLASELAKYLQRSSEKVFSYICGGTPESPPDRVKEIEKQLITQVGSGENHLLNSELLQHADSENPVQELAREISSYIEMAHLEQDVEELARLAKLTGWNQEELQIPSSRHGYWLLITNTLGDRKTQIALGIHEVLYTIKKEGAEWMHLPSPSDLRITLSENLLWIRVRLQHPFHPELFKQFSFVRCVPGVKGLTWVKPTERDRWILNDPHDGLKCWSFSHANLVTGFQAEDVWPQELGDLRLLLKQRVKPERPESANAEDWYKIIGVYQGSLDELPEQSRSQFRRDQDEHALITNRLASGFWEDVLGPQLADFPPTWWQIQAVDAGIRISTTHFPSMRECKRYGCDLYGRSFDIQLVEVKPSGKLHRAPWRKQCVQTLVERLQKDLAACIERVAIGPKRPKCAT